MRRKYPKTRSYVIRNGMTPTKERRRQNGGVFAETVYGDANAGTLIRRYRAVWECPLDAYWDKRVIRTPEYRAGLKFREAYFHAVLSRSARYERISRNTGHTTSTPSERILKEAYRTLSPYYKGAIIDICGHDLPARDRKKLDSLQKGLGQLAELWKLAADEVCGRD